MENQFVPFELAVKLKELGYECDYSFKEYDTEGYLQHTGLLNTHSLPHIDAPLCRQALAEGFGGRLLIGLEIMKDFFRMLGFSIKKTMRLL